MTTTITTITIDDLPTIVLKLKHMNLKSVARETGLHYMTVYTIAKGKNKSPSYTTIKKLLDFFVV